MRILLICPPADGLIRMLARDGHEVLAAENHAQALCLLRVFDPQVMLVALPQATECCRRLRQAVPDAAIVALVAGREVGERVGVLNAGADDCLSLPFAPVELNLRLRAVCARNSRRRVS